MQEHPGKHRLRLPTSAGTAAAGQAGRPGLDRGREGQQREQHTRSDSARAYMRGWAHAALAVSIIAVLRHHLIGGEHACNVIVSTASSRGRCSFTTRATSRHVYASDKQRLRCYPVQSASSTSSFEPVSHCFKPRLPAPCMHAPMPFMPMQRQLLSACRGSGLMNHHIFCSHIEHTNCGQRLLTCMTRRRRCWGHPAGRPVQCSWSSGRTV